MSSTGFIWVWEAILLLPSKQTKMLCKISSTLIFLIGLFLIPLIQTQDSSQDYVNEHNAARAQVGVGPLTWDITVATYAKNYSNQRVKDCALVHSNGPYGENLAWSSGNLSGTDAVQLWVSEKVNYDYNTNTCAEGQVCGHYTQVVWQNTYRIGCAKVRCSSGGSFISCNYDPPGNFIGERPYGDNPSAPAPNALTPNSSLVPPFISYPPEAVAPNMAIPPFISYPPEAAAPNMAIPPFISSNHRRMKIGLITGLIVGACIVVIVLCRVIISWKRKPHQNDHVFDVFLRDELSENAMGPRKFSYGVLANATNNFGEEEKLGEGGFGAVYRGFLRNLNIYVAVKRISRRSKQGTKEYATEIKIISRLRHKNTVKLIGWSHEKELILVYEFMPNGSLDSHLFKGKSLLTWTTRYKIIQDLASALLYLHEEGDHCVLHRDIKSSNIMLDSNFNAKLGDFGLARLVDHAKGSQTTALAGTMGYMAPECLTTGKASKESDVFSFGVVTLEVACGRRSIESKYEEAQVSLVPWVWESYGRKRLLDAVDKNLGTNFDVNQMECLMIVGLWCAHPDRNLRPSIRQVIHVLNFELPFPNLPCMMPVPKYEVPIAPALSSSGHGEPPLSLTIPR